MFLNKLQRRVAVPAAIVDRIADQGFPETCPLSLTQVNDHGGSGVDLPFDTSTAALEPATPLQFVLT